MCWGHMWRRCGAWGRGAEQMEAAPEAARRCSAQWLVRSGGKGSCLGRSGKHGASLYHRLLASSSSPLCPFPDSPQHAMCFFDH